MNHILISIIALLGLVCGILLTYSNKEELKPGKKYFLIAKKILAVIIAIISITYLPETAIIATVALILVFTLFVKHRFGFIVTYVLFVLLLFFSHNVEKVFVTNAAIIFLFGIPTGTLLWMKFPNNTS